MTISAYLNLGAGNTADVLVQNAVALLTQPAGAFTYYGRGIGDVSINIRGAVDCTWGPFPEMVSLKPHNDQTVAITWSVEFNIPTCGDARYTGPMEFQYDTVIGIDTGGVSDRTYKGFLRIAQNRRRQGDHTVRTSADEYREKINPPLLAGFRRGERNFTTSADKCRLDFSISDTELRGPNVPPPNVVEADAEHSLSTAQAGRLYEYMGSLSATYTIPKGNDLGVFDAIAVFKATLEDRLSGLRKAGVLKVFKKKPGILPVSFSATDASIYQEVRVRLDMKYRLVGVRLADILNSGGLWRPVPGSDWDKWSSSLVIPWGPRGGAGLKGYYPGEEQIVDLCARIPPDPIVTTTRPRPRIKPPRPSMQPASPATVFPPPAAAESWLSYSAMTRVETDSGTVVGKTLPGSPIRDATAAAGWNASSGMGQSQDQVVAPNDAHLQLGRTSGETFTQQRTSPTVFVFLSGYAVRAGYQIPTPELVSVNGAELVACNRADRGEYFEQGIVGQGGLDGGVPIYGAKWNLRYALLGDASLRARSRSRRTR